MTAQTTTQRPSTPIRVVFLIDEIEDEAAGTEKQLLLLLRWIDRSRFEPYLCLLRGRAREARYVVGFASFFSPRSYWRLWRFVRFLRREKIQIVQSHFRDSNIVASVAARLAGPVVHVATRRNQGYWHNGAELALVRLLNPWAEGFIVNAHAIERYVSEVERVPRAKIRVIYNALAGEMSDAQRTEARRRIRAEMGIAADAILIVAVCNLRPVKGIDVLLRALQAVAHEQPAAQTAIVGDGPLWAELVAQRDRLGLGGNVHFLGRRRDVDAILAAADVGVLGSHSEGLSNAVIEYMAAGLAVVATDVGGNPELVSHDSTGLLVAPGDAEAMARALLDLIADAGKRARLARRARERARSLFSLSACVSATERYYTDLIRDRGLEYGLCQG